jgi:hypothetical protein
MTARVRRSLLPTLCVLAACGSGGSSSTPERGQAPQPPGAPTQVAALPGNGRALVSWRTPLSDGGAAISGYQVTAVADGLPPVSAPALGTSLDLGGLSNGVSYTIAVAARNTAGLGPASAPAPAVTPAAVTAATGVFSDSRTAGLRYESGPLGGYTGPDGTFRYQPGSSVSFWVGGILVGTAPGALLVTPTAFVSSGSVSDPVVLRIARFLQTLDADGDPSNGIEIPWEAQLAGSTVSADLTTSAALDLGTLVAQLTSRPLVEAALAEAHLAATIRAAHVGTYAGTFSGDAAGTWQVAIDPSGVITGSATPTGAAPLAVTGQCDTAGSVVFTGSGTAGPATYAATLDLATGAMSGTWSAFGVDPAFPTSVIPMSGTFTGGRTALIYVGSYAGTYGGADYGTWTATVRLDGKVTGTGVSNLYHQSFVVDGWVTGAGLLQADIRTSGGASTGATWTAIFLDGLVSGSWQNGPGGGGISGMAQ